jgi:phosphoglycolate phosphatase
MPKARAIVFDLDGTLVDSLADITAATNHALGGFGREPLAESEIARYVGDGARMLLSRAARLDPGAPELERLLAVFLEYYTAHTIDHTRLAPGAEHALDELRRLKLAICTNKPRITTDALLGGLGLRERFSVVVAGGDLPKNKPDPLPLLYIAERLALEPSELVMVGDGPQDIECGRAANARTVGVLGGIANRERLLAAEPDVVIASLDELPTVIAGWS